MALALIDTCVLLDLLIEGPWTAWAMAAVGSIRGGLAINAVIYAEVAGAFATKEGLAEALPPTLFTRLELPFDAAWLAGRVHLAYRRAGGTRERTLPDFLIGAHAAVAGLELVTRDPRPYRHHFPRVPLVAPDTHHRAERLADG